MSMTTVEAFRALLDTPHFETCQRLAGTTACEQARETFLPVLQEALQQPTPVFSDLDYGLLYSLLTKNFEGQKLIDLDLSKLPLDRTNFCDARLCRVNLASSRLRKSNFSGALLEEVDLRKASAQDSIWEAVCFQDVDFSSAHLERARFQIESSHAGEEREREVCFDYAFLALATFRDSCLQKAQFSHAHMAHVHFKDSDATGTSFELANLYASRADRFIATEADFHSASLCCIEWHSATLLRANLADTRLIQANLSSARLDGAQLCSADLYQANLSGVAAQHANFSRADLTQADLSYSQLQQALMEHAIFYGCNFEGAHTIGTTFGTTFIYDQDTIIPPGSHDLISLVLLSCVTTWEERQFAAAIKVTPDWCWKEFIEKLKRSPDLILWARQALSSVGSLQQSVSTYERLVKEAEPQRTAQQSAKRTESPEEEHPF